MSLRRTRGFFIPFSLVALLFAVSVWSSIARAAVDPTQWTTTVNPMTRDSFGNPQQISFKISGPATTYAICLKLTSYPSYNTKASSYATNTYQTYKPCKKFTLKASASALSTVSAAFVQARHSPKPHPSHTPPPTTTTITTTTIPTTTTTTTSTTTTTTLPAAGSDTQTFGNNFTFGGPATYEVDWYVPDVPANGGTRVGTAGTFQWADSSGTLSPCPPDPQLQIGLWRPSRHKVLNRCKTVTAVVVKSVTTSSLDQDRGFRFGSTALHPEYMLRDKGILPSPSLNSTWTLTAVYVCDLYHGFYELHPVFKATNSSGTTYLTGPQYSTATPSVSGTWSLHSCA
jgi:hypothetical protein